MSLIDTFIEVSLPEAEDFLKVKETLTRIGIASRKENKLYQSCHILHKQNKYYIVHFKELFSLDGKPTEFSEEDKARRNTIANLLKEWGLINILKPELIESPKAPMGQIKIISHQEKKNWVLEAKYNIGKNRR
jgi:hypothetical protein